jgi:Cu-Zn family superoxide dismutase
MIPAMHRSWLAAIFLFGCPADDEQESPESSSSGGTTAGTTTTAPATSTDSSGSTAGSTAADTTSGTSASSGPDPSTGADSSSGTAECEPGLEPAEVTEVDGCAEVVGESFCSEGQEHVPQDTEVEWMSFPPHSGPHYPTWELWGEHDSTVPRGNWVHNLEHGGIVLSYRCADPCEAELDVLRDVVAQRPELRILLTPDPFLPGRERFAAKTCPDVYEPVIGSVAGRTRSGQWHPGVAASHASPDTKPPTQVPRCSLQALGSTCLRSSNRQSDRAWRLHMKTAFSSNILGTALLSVALLGAVGCDDDGGDGDPAARATARMIDADGNEIGTARFRTIEEGVLVTIDAYDLPPGEHAVHLHERAVCLAPSFESAGSHFDPHEEDHGFADEDGAHAGDLENLFVADDGTVHAYRVLEDVTLARGTAASSSSLLREGGTAIVIHMEPDDYRTDPAGNSGTRIACGEIEPQP